MRILKAVAVMFFLIAMLPGALWAQSPVDNTGKSYVVLKGGSYNAESEDLRRQDANNGFIGQIGFGYQVNRYFSVEAALGYQEFKATNSSFEARYQIYPLEVSGKLGFPIGIVEPYLIFGLGGYYVVAHAGRYEEDTYAMGIFGGGGVILNLSKSVFLGVEARYLALQASQPYYTYTLGSYHYVGSSDIHLDGVIVTGNLGFRF